MLGSDGVLDFKAWVNGLGVQTWGLQVFGDGVTVIG